MSRTRNFCYNMKNTGPKYKTSFDGKKKNDSVYLVSGFPYNVVTTSVCSKFPQKEIQCMNLYLRTISLVACIVFMLSIFQGMIKTVVHIFLVGHN
jgi:hypothetical protein